MQSRFLSAVLTAFALVSAYWAYALAVVPLVEPERPERARGVGAGLTDRGGARQEAFVPLAAAYFPPEHWALAEPPKIIECAQAKLVFANFEESENGRVRIWPCAILFFPNAPQPGEPPPADAIVMEAPEALLQFFGGFRPGQRQAGRLDWGYLPGDVTIRGRMQRDRPDDHFTLTTSKVQLNERRIWSDEDVAFTFGANSGSGTNLEIRFQPAAEASGPRRTDLDIGGIQSIEVRKNVRGMMHLDSAGLLPTVGRNAEAIRADEKPSTANQSPPRPVEIACDGSFFFHFPRLVATFDRNVRVTQANPTGRPDSITCHTLETHFARREEPKTLSDEPALGPQSAPLRSSPGHPLMTADSRQIGSGHPINFQPTLLRAHGAPVVVEAGSSGATARCEVLTYEIGAQRVTLESKTLGREVTLNWQAPDRQLAIRCPSVAYQLHPHAPRDRLGTLDASGPGSLVAVESSGDRDTPFTANWSSRVRLIRKEGQPVLSLYGKPQLAIGGLGDLSADQGIHLWLKEPLPNASDRDTLSVPVALSAPVAPRVPIARRPFVLPDKMLAIGNVHINSQRLSGNLNELQVWFEHLDDDPAYADQQPSEPSSSPHDNQMKELLRGRGKQGPAYVIENTQLLQLKLVVSGMATGRRRVTADVRHLFADGGVHLREQPTRTGAAVVANRAPFELHGQRLQVRDADLPTTFVELRGASGQAGPQLASISAQGAAMRGQVIKLDRAANRLWIESPGDLTLPLDRDLDGQPLARPQPVTITWNDRMDFDGARAEFTGGVLARGADNWMRTETMTATLQKPISMNAIRGPARPDINRLDCTGHVIVDRRETSSAGLIGHEHFEIASLSIVRPTGAIAGRGPGWITSVRFAGGPELLPTASRPRPRPTVIRGQSPVTRPLARGVRAPAVTARSGGTPSRLRYLRVDFQNGLDGNLKRREVNLNGQVHAIYGPVDSWEQTITIDGPGWTSGGTLLDCDTLSVNQMAGGPRQSDWVDLIAEGNVKIEGFTPRFGPFTAEAQRLTYDQRKDLIKLDGGTSDAHIWAESATGPTSGHHAARQISYWRSQGRIVSTGNRALDLDFFKQ